MSACIRDLFASGALPEDGAALAIEGEDLEAVDMTGFFGIGAPAAR